MSAQDLEHPWKPSVRIIWIGAIVLGSWLLQGSRICVKEPYFTIFCGKLCRIGQDHAEPGEKQDIFLVAEANPENLSNRL